MTPRGPRWRSAAITAGLTRDARDFAALADQLAAGGPATDRVADATGSVSAGGLGAVLDALETMRGELDADELIAAAPRRLCGTGVFDRVLWSSVSGSTWLPEALYVTTAEGGPVREIDDEVHRPIALSSPLVEAEVVRRRVPALVNDAPHEPRTHAPLVRRTGTQDYVVATVVAMGSVIGLLHADRRPGKAPVSEVDRDLLRLFSDGIGVLYERTVLHQRAEEQRRSVAAVCDAAMQVLTRLDEAPVADLEARPVESPRDGERQPGSGFGESHPSGRLARLTAREREVLALLASGATNAQLADRLTVAESTVKSHVKHILHKLGTGNRAAAIAFYLRESRADEGRSR